MKRTVTTLGIALLLSHWLEPIPNALRGNYGPLLAALGFTIMLLSLYDYLLTKKGL